MLFNSIFDLIIILIPIAIVIGRIVVRYRNRHNPPPPSPPQPHIAIHFEDDDDDSEYQAKPAAVLEKPKEFLQPPMFRAPMEANFKSKLFDTPAVVPAPRAPGPVVRPLAPPVPPPASQSQENGLPNLDHLSPLKQAVVMAEILGPPKALQ